MYDHVKNHLKIKHVYSSNPQPCSPGYRFTKALTQIVMLRTYFLL